MSGWEILGIEPTDDISSIKKAYAVKLKIHHPEEDPEGYQLLREAYDEIMKQHRQQRRVNVTEFERIEDEIASSTIIPIMEEEVEKMPSSSLITMVEEDLDYDFIQQEYIDNDYEIPNDPITEWLNKIEMIYDDFYERISYENWVELLNSDIIWNFEKKKIVSHQLLNFIMEHHHLPKHIWLLLEDTFQWKEEMETQLAEYEYEDERISQFYTYYKQRLLGQDYYTYEYLVNAGEIDFDTFLSQREDGVTSFIECNYEKARESLERAIAIYPKDPETLRMYGFTLHALQKRDEAMFTFKQLLDFDKYVFEANYMLATILHQNKQYEESYQYCEYALKHRDNHLDSILLTAKNLFFLGKLNDAREILLELRDAYPNDIETNAYLAKVHSVMYREGKKERANSKGSTIFAEIREELNIYSVPQWILTFIRTHPVLLVVFILLFLRLNYLIPLMDNPLVEPIRYSLLFILGEMSYIDPINGMEIVVTIVLYYYFLYLIIKRIIRLYKYLRY